ncbi:MAG TPA: Ni/Fe-hydrogenase cytochrome b subunit [Candidatus Saccharimonadales bacterium]|nr:Ni/Fe-hydrogenase cytochrome b subunit [Candidatus Saccharimonadales bacterium]
MTRWERSVPVYGVPVLTRGFWALLALIVVGLALTVVREVVGLGGLMSGMSDPFAWGLWKTFNVMVLTGLGSGGFAVGIAAWVFNNKKLHSVMRVALITSCLAYWTGLCMLGVDVGRPWNFYWVVMPWTWNLHSPLLEIAVCMSLYASVPLFLENLPPLFEYIIYEWPQWRGVAEFCEKAMAKVYPFIIGLAYILPIMHQSSLGALMILGGNRVNTLWQTPFLPLIYVWAAGFLGYNCVVLCLLLAKLAWKRDVDPEVMLELNKLTVWIVYAWTAFRFLDILFRGKFFHLFTDGYYSILFWTETALILGSAYVLSTEKGKKLGTMFLAHAVCALGGMIYRFSPTTLAFHAKDGATYFPSAIELIISLSFVSIAVLAYMVAVKKLAILPGSNEDWLKMAKYEEQVKLGIQLTGYVPVEH